MGSIMAQQLLNQEMSIQPGKVKRMKTVIQVVQHLKPGGLEALALDILRFSANKDSMYILSLEGTKASALDQWPRLEAVADKLIFLDKEPGFSPELILTLTRIFRRMNAEIVHTHHIGPLLYAGLAARLARVPTLIHTEHDAWHLANEKRCRLQKLALTFSRPLLVADGAQVAYQLYQRLKRRNVMTILNGIDTERFQPGSQEKARQSLGLPQDALLIGTAGRLEPVKRQFLLIEVLPELPHHVHLVIAGHGSMADKLFNHAISLNVTERVHFMGLVEDMPQFYQALDLFCLVSAAEGYPLTPLEAQACGIPAAVTDVGASRETLCPFSGMILSPEDPRTLTYQLTTALMTKPRQNPRHHILQHNDARKMALAYDELGRLGKLPA
ncbi:glycosyltransferase [Photobacterium sp. R1]